MKLLHLIMIASVFMLVMVVGCVPKSQLKKQYDLGLIEGRKDSVLGCADEIYRLKMLLKNRGVKAPVKPKWTGDTWEDDVDGTESWQK